MDDPTPGPGDLAYEFPDFDASTLPVIPDGFSPTHWHNDVCPSWSLDALPDQNLSLWIDYADPALREYPEKPRFLLHWAFDPAAHSNVWCLEATDDWDNVLDALAHLDARVIAAKWIARLGIGFHPDTPGADYVYDRLPALRCLDDAAAAEYDADMARLLTLPGDPYHHALAALSAATNNKP